MIRVLVSVGALLFLSALPVQAQDRLALVVGIDKYEKLPQLNKAGNDAAAVGTALGKLGFEATVVRDTDRRSFNRTLSDFLNKIKPGAIVYFHFSGHGVSIDGDSYLIPADMDLPRAGDREFVKREAIRLSELIESFKAAQAQARIMVIDACRENPFAQKGVRNVGTRGGLALVPAPKGTLIMYSAADGQLALDQLGPDDKERTSVYTRTLLKHLAQPDVDLVAAARAIRAEVERIAASIGHEQRPAYYDELSDQLILAAAAAINAKRAAVSESAEKAPSGEASSSIKSALAGDRILKETDLQGINFLTIPLAIDDPSLCQSFCRADERCSGWTYVPPWEQEKQARCWFKSFVTGTRPIQCCMSGIERVRPNEPYPPAKVTGEMLPGIDFAEGNLRNFQPTSQDPRQCRTGCRNDRRCMAWTYQRPVPGWPNGMCWLKNTVGYQRAMDCCVSGIERVK